MIELHPPAPTALPVGAICMWGGSLASIPPGWHICDGTAGTPDLRDKFVMGSAIANIGETGGYSESQLLYHRHNRSSSSTPALSDHTHFTVSLNANSAHEHAGEAPASTATNRHGHTVRSTNDAAGTTGDPRRSSDSNEWGATGALSSSGSHSHTTSSSYSGSHSHEVAFTAAPAHDHSVSLLETGVTPSEDSNLPPYCTLFFIQRVT